MHYIKYLQKRLLGYTEPSRLIYESKVIECLKFEGFSDFAIQTEIPVNDVRLSFNLKSSFETYNYTKYSDRTEAVINNHIEFDFKVLTSDFWSFRKSPHMEVPQEVNSIQYRFEEFFFQRFKERKLVWKNAVGRASLFFHLPHFERRKELVTTTVQACICLALQEAKQMVFREIASTLKLKDEALLTTELKGLLYSKIVISSNNEKVKDKLEPDSVFSLNLSFKSQKNLISVKAFKMVEEEKKDEQKTDSDFLLSKQMKITSCLMRIMKSSKKMTFQELIAQASRLLEEFIVPKSREIQQGIEELINKEYLKRDEADFRLLHYN